jgi:hypothetical protein
MVVLRKIVISVMGSMAHTELDASLSNIDFTIQICGNNEKTDI